VRLQTSIIFILIALIPNSTIGQISNWFQTLYTSKSKSIDYLFDKDLQLEEIDNGPIVLFSDKKIEVFTKNGVLDFYITPEHLFKLYNDRRVKLIRGETLNRKKYLLKILNPNSYQKSKFDTSLIYEIDNEATFLGIKKIPKSTEYESSEYKRSFKIDSVINLSGNQMLEFDKEGDRYIIINEKNKIIINNKKYTTRLIRESNRVRHYVIEEYGGQILIKELEGNKNEIIMTDLSDNLLKIYCRN